MNSNFYTLIKYLTARRVSNVCDLCNYKSRLNMATTVEDDPKAPF